MVTAAVTEIVKDSGTSVWLAIVVAFGSGLAGSLLTWWQTRKIVPKQQEELEATVQKLAVDTVESALKVARERIAALEADVKDLTEKIGELRGRLAHESEDRRHVREQLDLALVERAKLQQQLAELNTRLGSHNLEGLFDVTPPDAIVMVDMGTGKITYANEGVFGLLGYVPSELIGQPLEKIVPKESRTTHVRERNEYAAHPRNRPMGMGLPLFALSAAESVVPVDISLHPTGDGRVLALLKKRRESL